MARAGETPEAQFKGLAYGENQAANDLVSQAPADLYQPYDPRQEFQPQGEDQQFLYGPTDIPEQPVTTGAPVGPGASYVVGTMNDPNHFARQVAAQISADPDSPDEAKAFAARVARGL